LKSEKKTKKYVFSNTGYDAITMTLRCRPLWPGLSCRRNVGVLRCLMRPVVVSLFLVFYTWNLWYMYRVLLRVLLLSFQYICVLIRV